MGIHFREAYGYCSVKGHLIFVSFSKDFNSLQLAVGEGQIITLVVIKDAIVYPFH